MPRVTLYVKDSAAQVWERAKALVGDGDESLSSLVTEALEALVSRREREVAATAKLREQMKQIDLAGFDFDDPGQPRNLRFVGVCVGKVGEAAAYVTRGHKIITESSGQGGNYYSVFNSFDELRVHEVGEEMDQELMSRIADSLGARYIEEIE